MVHRWHHNGWVLSLLDLQVAALSIERLELLLVELCHQSEAGPLEEEVEVGIVVAVRIFFGRFH